MTVQYRFAPAHPFPAQLDDVKASRRELSKVIKAIDEEIVNVFAAAFADVSQNFTQLFTTLFPGGTGSIRLTDPEDLLETVIEVELREVGGVWRSQCCGTGHGWPWRLAGRTRPAMDARDDIKSARAGRGHAACLRWYGVGQAGEASTVGGHE